MDKKEAAAPQAAERVNNLSKETLTPIEVARLIGRGQMFVEKALRTKQFPVGCAVYDKDSDRWSYLIPKSAFENWLRGSAGKCGE